MKQKAIVISLFIVLWRILNMNSTNYKKKFLVQMAYYKKSCAK